MEESKSDCVTSSPVAEVTPNPLKSPPQPMGLSSPELLKELKQPHSLKHVSAHTGLTRVFSGRGRQKEDIHSPPKLQQ
ncbi:hypothetical protein DNTS_027661 [Danionella cerebrum]|uniref:Uncharacterized protein n=1 Tax=Danionella cerebrum TaxID=2873325 RepID=A0A553NH40_9TELE|nr:hypothetical protein DNTS_027661 [Danionella translucida]